MTLVASLGMYDGDGVQEANDLFWSLIAAHLIDHGVRGVPPRLDRDRPLEEIWNDPNLLLAQCCGYPLVTRFRGRLRTVATPGYDAPGCQGAFHRSRIVVRTEDEAEGLADLKGRRAAINERRSNSGANLFRAAIAPLAGGGAFFGSVIETGSHEASLLAVASGEADVAAIDTVSYAHLSRRAPHFARSLRTIGWTAESPCLPFVTAMGNPNALLRLLRAAISQAMDSQAMQPAREALLLNDLDRLPAKAYDRLLRFERDAGRMGYPELL